MSGAGVSHGPSLTQDGSGNLITSTGNALDVNIKTSSGGVLGKIDFAPVEEQLTQAAINVSSSGDNTVVAAGSGAQTVKIYRMMLTVAGSTTLTFKSGAGTSLTGPMSFGPNGSIVLDFTGEPWFTTGAATAFVINSSNAVQVSGRIGSVTS